MDISIIILNYKSKGLVLNCVKSIKEADWNSLKYEIIVVDNHSEDSIGEILAWQNPEVKFIASPVNLGMGGGNNLGLKAAQGKYVVIMNPDTIAFTDTFKSLFAFMENNPQVGLTGPLQYNPDQTVQDSCFRWFGIFTPLYRRTPLGRLSFAKKDLARFLMKDFDKLTFLEVDWLMGSCLFCRTSALQKVGYFDERFFMYFEDTDLCRRFWQNGWQVVFYPAAKIIHNHIRQSAQDPWYVFFYNRSARQHIVSWFKYFCKWGIKGF